MLLLSSIVAAALARPTVVELTAPLDLDLPGRHARPFVDRDGAWRIGFGRSGSFHSVPWDGSQVSLEDQTTHVLLGDGVDHGWVRCPDGGFLHVASQNRSALDDSAVATRLDADLTAIAQRVVVSESPDLATNDMAVVCGVGFEGVAFAERGTEGEEEAGGDLLYRLDAAFFGGAAPSVEDISESTRVTGNTLLWDDAHARLLSIGLERDLGMVVVSWNSDLSHESSTAVSGPEPPLVGWWSQGAVPLDDHWLVVHMQGDPADAWGLDTGEVALLLLDADFGVVERHTLTSLLPPDGAMRPSLAVQDGALLVTFDVNGAIRLVTGRIAQTEGNGDGDGTGEEEPADGLMDNSGHTPGDDSGHASTQRTEAGTCGCTGSRGAGTLALGLLCLGAVRRTQETAAHEA